MAALDNNVTSVSIPRRQSDEQTLEPAPWHPATRLAFRFCFAYLGLFCLWFAQITFVFTGIAGQWFPDDAMMWQMVTLEPVTSWVGSHVLGVDSVIPAVWVGVFCVLAAAAIATAVWSVLDRRCTEYSRLCA